MTRAQKYRQRRPDLTDAEYAELQAIKERGSRGMCSNADLERWATLEPFRANSITSWGGVVTWRVDCQLPGINYGCGPSLPTESKARELADWLCRMYVQATGGKHRVR